MSATALPTEHRTDPDPSTPVTFMWLEITGKCQLECGHCYADSGPQGDHGTMTAEDWRSVIDDAASAGVRMVQFIGGEPTLHPDLAELIDHALAAGLEVEVYSNLVHVSDPLWQRFTQRGVRLATSFYSSDREQHAQVVGRDTLRQTQANIERAVRDGIPIRIGRVDVIDGQDNDGAAAWLTSLGIEVDPYVDHVRGVGRGTASEPNLDALCGNCASNVLAVGPTGLVWPCVFSRFLPIGNVKATSLAAVLAGRQLAKVRDRLSTHFAARRGDPCYPNCAPACSPMAQCMPRNLAVLVQERPCEPGCAPHCGPNCSPGLGCRPNVQTDQSAPGEHCSPDASCRPDDWSPTACAPDRCAPDLLCNPYTPHDGCSPACWPTTGCSPMCSPSCNPSHHAEPPHAWCVPDRCAPDLQCTPKFECNPKVLHDCLPDRCGPDSGCRPMDPCGPRCQPVQRQETVTAGCIPNRCGPESVCSPWDELQAGVCDPPCAPATGCNPVHGCKPHPVDACQPTNCNPQNNCQPGKELVSAGAHTCNPDLCYPNCTPTCSPAIGCTPR